MQRKFTYYNLQLEYTCKHTSWINNVAIIELKAFTYLRNVLLNFAFFAQDAIILDKGVCILCMPQCMSSQHTTARLLREPHDPSCTKNMQKNTVPAHTNLNSK